MLATISANDLAKVIRNLDSMNYTQPTHVITRYLEYMTQKRFKFAALVLAMIQCGYSVIPHSTSVRFVPTQTNANVAN